jgi:hypothetical protein
MVPETSIYSIILTRLTAREDFIKTEYFQTCPASRKRRSLHAPTRYIVTVTKKSLYNLKHFCRLHIREFQYTKCTGIFMIYHQTRLHTVSSCISYQKSVWSGYLYRAVAMDRETTAFNLLAVKPEGKIPLEVPS